MQKYRKQIQLVFEFLIPLIGVIAGWGYEMLLFYLALDILAKATVNTLMWRKMKTEGRVSPKMNKEELPWMMLWQVLMWCNLYFIGVLASPGHNLDFNQVSDGFSNMLDAAGNEIWLIPLIGVAAYLSYSIEFVRGMMYRVWPARSFFKRRTVEIAMLLFIVIVLAFSNASESATILSIAFVKLISEFMVLRQELKILNNNITKGY